LTVRFNMPRPSAFDANGNPRSGAKLYFYEPTTLTPKDVYSDSGLTTPISQPVTATSAGLWATIFCQASLYRVILKDSNDVTIWDEDNYDPGLAAGFGVSSVVGVAQGGTGAANAASARANLGAASSEGQTLLQNDVTELDTLVETGLHSDGDRFGLLAKEDTVTRALMAAGTGQFLIQRVKHETVSDSTISTTTPAYDTSVPQLSEGDQVFTYAFTPLSASSSIRISVHVTGDGSASSHLVLALFKNSDANAIAADGFYISNNAVPLQGQLYFEEASGSTSARTYSIRAGVSNGTITINGSTGSFGGSIRKSYLLIEEWVTV
jgi:hypothetical protein